MDEPEVEPRVLTEDVRDAIQPTLKGSIEDSGESVAMLAERAGCSTRTVYRVLGLRSESLSLDLGDRLLVAAGKHLSECRLVWPDGRIE